MRKAIQEELDRNGGILRALPAYVARDWLPAGRRLGLEPEQYDVGERGEICERWLASTTPADNRIGPDNEGVSPIRVGDEEVLLTEVLQAAGDLVLGEEYASTHEGLGRLLKIFDYAERIPHHIHPPAEVAARVGRNSKDEAYVFLPGVERGPHPETFFGILPHLTREEASARILAEIRAWDSDDILGLSPAYLQPEGEGFMIESGILHGPGTALTLELQEESDAMSMWQALNAGKILDQNMLYKDVSDHDRATRGEEALMDWMDWDANLDPYFYRNHHTPPLPIASGDGYRVEWAFYGTPKFSGKRVFVEPGGRVSTREKGVYSLFVWSGEGTIGGLEVKAGIGTLDELIVTHERAVSGVEYVSTGSEPLEVFTVFGPDINDDAPTVPGRAS